MSPPCTSLGPLCQNSLSPSSAPPCRQKATEQEGKLRAAIADKNNFQLEKAGLERELKALRSQAEKLTKNMDKVGPGGGARLWIAYTLMRRAVAAADVVCWYGLV